MKITYTPAILEQLRENGLNENAIEQQLRDFENGFPHANLQRPAIVGDGIQQIDETAAEHFRQLFKLIGSEQQVHRFVPASGAATRMFKALFAFLENGEVSEAVSSFVENIKSFAFAGDIPEEILKSEPKVLIDYVLNEGLNYGNSPKALIKFHRYGDEGRVALAEHFYESSRTLGDIQANIHIHFTISPEHAESFKKTAGKLALDYGNRFEDNFILEYTEQSPATQCIAVDEKNNPIILDDGKLLLRPGGHGALIHNLAAVYSDIIFIKNIDNVCHEKQAELSIEWKEILAGKLIDIRQQVFEHIDELLEKRGLAQACAFLKKEFGIECDEDIDEVFRLLNRPIRVCGMVKNEAEPGGGPFWVKNRNGETSLQIIESAQIDINNPEQKKILEQSSHFNPVDIVCSTKDYIGDKFRLLEFVDPYTGFITEKSFEGEKIKAMELPGLWNGAMANWLTVFVEVPSETFNPVKVVNDLLKTPHQES